MKTGGKHNSSFHFNNISVQDHIVQWHPTILAKLALVPQRVMNSYSAESKSAAEDGKYKDNDFIVRLAGCDTELRRNCEKEMESYWRMVKK